VNKHAISVGVVGRRIGVCHRRLHCCSVSFAPLCAPLYIKTFHFVIINKAIVEKSVCMRIIYRFKSCARKWNILCLLERAYIIYIYVNKHTFRWWEDWRRRFFQMTCIWRVARGPNRVSTKTMFLYHSLSLPLPPSHTRYIFLSHSSLFLPLSLCHYFSLSL